MTERASGHAADAPGWREDIDSLSFRLPGHGGHCVVHRRAFRALVGREGDAQACLAWFARHRSAFEAAAMAKIRRQGLAAPANLHINSRDIRRAALELRQSRGGDS